MNSEKIMHFYKMYPDKLIERLYPNIKLYHYQKLLLKLMIRNKEEDNMLKTVKQHNKEECI